MFSYLSGLLSRLKSAPIPTVLMAALAILVLSVILVNFVRWLRRRRQHRPDNWWGLLTGSLGSVLTMLVGIGIVVGLSLYLSFQAKEFARLRGGTSERNYNAVKQIWGRPHIQRELSVQLVKVTKKYFDKDGLEFDPEKLRATTQPIAYRAVDVEDIIPGNPILSANHDFQLTMNYRRKGNATYPGFEVDGRFNYVVENFAWDEFRADFYFPLPRYQGLVDNLRITVDGKPLTVKPTVDSNTIRWKMPLKKGQRINLSIAYHSRGLDYIRLEPGSSEELPHYRVRMACAGVAKSDLNYPIGCMTPTRIAERDGATTLEWDLDNAVTRFGMGVILPKQTQEGFGAAKLLSAAPWGLILLVGVTLATLLAGGRTIPAVPMLILVVGYMLYNLLAAHLMDYLPGLLASMAVSGGVLSVLVGMVMLARLDRFAAVSVTALFVVFCSAYPLLRLSEYSDLLLTIFYAVLLAWLVALLTLRRSAPMAMGATA